MNRILDARRPLGRFFCCLISLLLAVLAADASGPATTSVTDTVYRADGTPAAGTLVITWQAFTTAEGKAVAAGVKTVKIGAQGAVSIPLVPNFGATPAGTYYKVTYKLDDGTTSEEYWSVPAAPATTISAIRSKLVPANVAVQYATRQYVDSMLAGLGGGGSGNAVKIQGKDVDAAEPTRGQSLTFDGTKYKPVSHPEVDVVRDCGAVGDGVTDDGPTIQTCINNHPGKTIFFPTTGASVSGGGPATNPSYYSSQTLTLSGNNQRLTGDTGGMWSGGAAIKFAAGVTGIIVPSTCYSCKVEHLELQSADYPNASSANGIYVQGGHARLSDLVVNGFGNNCIEIDGATANANTWRASYILMNACKSHGWYAHGTDCNAGVGIGLYARTGAAAVADIEDACSFPNTYIAPETDVGSALHYKDSAGGGAIWIGAYEEGGNPSDITGKVLGGNMTVQTNSFAPVKYPSQLWGIGNGRGVGPGTQMWLEVWNQRDEDTTPTLRSGATADQDTTLRWLSYNSQGKWGIRRTASNNTFKVWNYLTNSAALSFDPTSNAASFAAGVSGTQLTSTVATGAAPLAVSSTTPVTNLTLSADSQLPTISSAGKVAASALPDAQRRRICEVHIGSAGGSPLADGDDEPASCFNDYGVSLTISAVRCYADAGSPTVQLARNDSTNILSGNLTCGTAAWAPADGQSGRPSISANSLGNGQWFDVNIVSAGGAAKYIRIVVTMQ